MYCFVVMMFYPNQLTFHLTNFINVFFSGVFSIVLCACACCKNIEEKMMMYKLILCPYYYLYYR